MDTKALDDAAAAWMSSLRLRGASLLVVQGGKTLHEQYYGSYSPQTVIPIASASKWLSGATVLALVERGKLELDAPVSRYLPEFAVADKAGITIRMLFNHTSGLPSHENGVMSVLADPREAARRAATLPLLSKPGTVFHYGGVGMQLLAGIVEAVAGKTWRDVFSENIARPLGMKNTTYGRSALARNPMVAGGANSSLNDYGRFLRMLWAEGRFDGKQVLKPESVRELITDRTGKVRDDSPQLSRILNGFHGYGVGCWIEEKDSAGNALAASSPGAFGFYPWLSRKKDAYAIWMIQSLGANQYRGKLPRIVQTVESLL